MSQTRSPFPPIADYGFLSDCHTGALVAPDGSVDWLCLPAFDSPSVFANILDRGAGSFRFGPYGINVPTQRTYVPGTNVLVTTWHTPGGWLRVHDALVMGPRQFATFALPARECFGLRRSRFRSTGRSRQSRAISSRASAGARRWMRPIRDTRRTRWRCITT